VTNDAGRPAPPDDERRASRPDGERAHARESRPKNLFQRRTERGLEAQGWLQSLIRRLRLPRSPLIYLAIFGPGLIAANAGNDAGGVITYAQVGAAHGYDLLWVLVIITVSLAVIQEMCARMGAVTGKGFSDLVREQFGIRWTAAIVVALFFANGLTAFSEFVGIAAAMEMVGVSRYIAVPIAGVVLWLLVTRGSYRAVERIFLLMTVAFFAYPISAILAHPNWKDVGTSLVVPHLHNNSQYLIDMIALIGTTVTPYMQIYVQSAVVDKGVTPRDYPLERLDVYLGTLFGNTMSAFMIIATGAAFLAAGSHLVSINSAADAARALEPLAGSAAKPLFAVGLLGASMLAAGVLPLTTAYSVAEAFGFEKGVSFGFRDAPVFMGIFTGFIALGVLVALIPNLPLVSVLIAVQVVNGVLLPVVLVAALRLTNDAELMGRYRNGPIFNTIAVLMTVFVGALSIALLVVTLGGLF
jgi:NRAMP (natural resistance-associated macrophage protein)-like metal ion transporter